MSTADFPSMTTAEIRSTFLKFFEERGLKLYPSSSLVPDDPSLLLANAGMNQFKEYYQGKKTMKEIGACSCQKCVRTNDIDCIGEDGRHLSFFEMLGDFSFGGVSKEQACAWAFELITEKFHLPVERLYFTIFTDDDETHDVWRSLGVPEDHISRLGEDDNFWAAGPTGPCGPCSEIYFDQGEDVGCGKPDCAPGCDCDRFLEFWNLVFTQFDRQEDGSLPELPHRNLDTGMGLERMAAIMQHKSANYDGDLMQSLIALGEEISGKTYDANDYSGASRSLRIIADHARAVDFMISDGILPGNEGREYVLRRLLRRAVFHGRLLGIEGAFLTKFIDEVNRLMGEAYPELLKNVALVKGIVAAEEERFSTTLDTGRTYLDEAIAGLAEGAVLPGEVAFKLHDTYGFPIDLTVEISAAAGHDVDMDGFDVCMTEQKERARANANRDAWGDFNNVWTELSDKLAATEFEGYDANAVEDARVVAIVANGESVERAEAGADVEVILDRTPFYAEMGGQVGDTGTISAEGVKLEVSDTKGHNGLFAHLAHVAEGAISVGDVVCAAIDAHRRELIRRNHTATHLLDAALKTVLGEHVSQAGSLCDDSRLRFDFTHFEALTAEQLHEVEDLVNVEIFAAKPVVTRVCSIDEAKEAGAIALFGEKYGDVVRMVSVGNEDQPFSRELCGGTHARNSSELGLFKIVSESSTGSNVRRIEAVTSLGALAWLDERNDALDAVASELKCRPEDAASRIADMKAAARDLEGKLKQALLGGSSDKIQTAMAAAIDCGSYKAVIARMDGLEAGQLREAWDAIRDKATGDVACFLATNTPEGKVALLAAATDGAVAAGFGAGDVIRNVAGHVGGRGGGRPNMAQAGGKDASGIDAALAAAREMLS
ncbi:MAG: alanine--tRNA ligase [Parolsenella sp.]|uniref:alanine--tRNA ligase n=1 Tax=Parolsenella sp. TaxID=2083006 RepID=UPI002A748183|nr:alanine--tRNA ligase [Parolsenella sp.]MCI5949111.1 alanine--tRNA ligase [Coriobacteriaceae bacterium]MDY3291363.1 alanine--tRNA ligase [Parolsenella sp.]